MKTIVIYNIMIAIGVILFSVSIMTRESMTGAVFYLIHDMIIKAALFLIVGIVMAITGYSSVKKIQWVDEREAFARLDFLHCYSWPCRNSTS